MKWFDKFVRFNLCLCFNASKLLFLNHLKKLIFERRKKKWKTQWNISILRNNYLFSPYRFTCGMKRMRVKSRLFVIYLSYLFIERQLFFLIVRNRCLKQGRKKKNAWNKLNEKIEKLLLLNSPKLEINLPLAN